MTTWQSDLIELADDLEAFNAYALEQRWSDGLPLIPPTEARVERMLAGSPRPHTTVIARLPVEDAECTVEKIAINAVMAGCRPDYMPLLIATVSAVAQPANWLRVLDTAERPQIDQGICHQLHPIVSLLDAFKS